jgi:hypothetical protein
LEVALVSDDKRKPYVDQMVCKDGKAPCVCPVCGIEHEVRAALIYGFRKNGRFLLSCNSRVCAEKAIKIREGRKG